MEQVKAIYVRQSVDKKDSISIESQIDFCKSDCRGAPYKVFKDKGYSGKNTNRPSFKEMMKEVKEGKISEIIVYRLDRISRSLLDFSEMMEVLKKYSVTFNSTQEKFDTSTPMGNAMLSISMVFAQLERETIQQRIRDNYYQRAKLGVHLGGVAPYGYKLAKSTLNGKKVGCLEENSEEIEVLKSMFLFYVNDKCSLGEVARKINAMGFKTRNGIMWRSDRVSLTLRNPVCVIADADVYDYYTSKGCDLTDDIELYKGQNACIYYGKRNGNERRYSNPENQKVTLSLHNGVIPSDIFLKCQYMLDSNTQIKREGMGKHTWLSGIVKCGKCGRNMTICSAKKNINDTVAAYMYFRCPERLTGACINKKIPYRKDKIETVIKERLETLISQSKWKYQERSMPIYDDNSGQIKILISKIETQINNLTEQLANGNEVVTKYIADKITELDSQKNELLSKKVLSEIKFQKGNSIISLINEFKNFDAATLNEQKAIMKEFIEKITLDDETINIFWKENFREYLDSAFLSDDREIIGF